MSESKHSNKEPDTGGARPPGSPAARTTAGLITPPSGTLRRFVVLYTALFLAFGVASPFLAVFLRGKGLAPAGIGFVLAAGTATRLAAGPLFGRLADRFGRSRAVLILCLTMAGVTAFFYLPFSGLGPLLLVSIAQAAVLAPTTAIADALTLTAIRGGYGRVRAAGSGAFILGTLLAGQAVARSGLSVVIWLNGTLLIAAAAAGAWVPDCLRRPAATTDHPGDGGGSVRAHPPEHQPPVAHRDPDGTTVHDGQDLRLPALFRLPGFTRMMLVAALIQGSHAFHDGFVVVHWRSLGIGGGTIGVLWSESVAAEILVFLALGPFLLNRLGIGGASILAACGGILRWAVLASTTSVFASALVEPMHGLTFALQHLACMRLIAAVVPHRLAASAQTFYGSVAVGATTAAMTLLSGALYGQIGAAGFWVMAVFCASAIPLARSLPRGP